LRLRVQRTSLRQRLAQPADFIRRSHWVWVWCLTDSHHDGTSPPFATCEPSAWCPHGLRKALCDVLQKCFEGPPGLTRTRAQSLGGPLIVRRTPLGSGRGIRRTAGACNGKRPICSPHSRSLFPAHLPCAENERSFVSTVGAMVSNSQLGGERLGSLVALRRRVRTLWQQRNQAPVQRQSIDPWLRRPECRSFGSEARVRDAIQAIGSSGRESSLDRARQRSINRGLG
jgi:hypothetical protein